MSNASIEDRKAKLLDQLENPGITSEEIEQIERKLKILESQGA